VFISWRYFLRIFLNCCSSAGRDQTPRRQGGFCGMNDFSRGTEQQEGEESGKEQNGTKQLETFYEIIEILLLDETSGRDLKDDEQVLEEIIEDQESLIEPAGPLSTLGTSLHFSSSANAEALTKVSTTVLEEFYPAVDTERSLCSLLSSRV